MVQGKVLYESIEKKEDFTFETVLSSEYKLDILRKAKEEGYFIKCVFVLTVDPMKNVQISQKESVLSKLKAYEEEAKNKPRKAKSRVKNSQEL